MPVGACIIGGIAGVLVIWSVFFFDKIKIDDPVGAISVHGVNGAWGPTLKARLISSGFRSGIPQNYSPTSFLINTLLPSNNVYRTMDYVATIVIE